MRELKYMHPKTTITTHCCPDSIKHKAIFLQFNSDEAEEAEALTDLKPLWHIKGLGESGGESWVIAKFCPFCAAPVPEIELNPDIKKRYLYEMRGDGYCKTCTENNRNCRCTPPEFRWRPVGVKIERPKKG